MSPCDEIKHQSAIKTLSVKVVELGRMQLPSKIYRSWADEPIADAQFLQLLSSTLFTCTRGCECVSWSKNTSSRTVGSAYSGALVADIFCASVDLHEIV